MAPGREPVPERTPEERARAAAERAARRAGRSAPPAARAIARTDEPSHNHAIEEPRTGASGESLAPDPFPEARAGADDASLAAPHEPQDAAEWSSEWDFEPEPVGVGAERARTPGAAAIVPRRDRTGRRASAAPAARPGQRGSVAAVNRRPTGAGGRWRRRLAAAVAMAALAAVLWGINATFQPVHGSGSGAVRVVIAPGANARAIGARLEQGGVIDSGFFFGLNATLTMRRDDLRDGSYLLRKGMTNGEAIEALMQGPKAKVVRTFTVTIPEGLSRREAAPVVRRAGVEGDYLKATSSATALRRARGLGLPRRARTLEGFLFPATFTLTAGASARDLVDRQLAAFGERMSSVSLRYAKRRHLTRYDVLIIASMIEREASLARERPLIAAVIYNRLARGMPLGIDATIRYAENNWTRPLRVSELQRDTPYNTRLRRGLPPTPIGNPGLASLRAAAHPASKHYLFYVRKPGKSGEHAFSSTDARFERDVQRYQASRKNP